MLLRYSSGRMFLFKSKWDVEVDTAIAGSHWAYKENNHACSYAWMPTKFKYSFAAFMLHNTNRKNVKVGRSQNLDLWLPVDETIRRCANSTSMKAVTYECINVCFPRVLAWILCIDMRARVCMVVFIHTHTHIYTNIYMCTSTASAFDWNL